MRKKILTIVASLAILAGGVFTYLAVASPAEATSFGSSCGPKDNDANAIIRNGACSTSAMKDKVKGDVKNVFSHYNVPANMAGAKKGEVRYNGDVVVDGKVVATGAETVGRTKVKNSKTVKIDGKNFYQGKPKDRWIAGTKAINAFVFFDKNGEFKSAVLTSCGNPVTAKPKPKVAYKCDNLTAKKIDRTRHDLEVKTSQHRATFQSVTFNVYDKDGNKVESKTSNSKSYRYTQTTPGEYTIKAVVTFKTHDGKTVKSKESDCVTKIEVEAEPCPYNPELPKDDPKCEEPKKPVYDCDSLTGKLIGEATDRTYQYTVEYTAENGAKLESADFSFGDGNKKDGVKPSELDDVTHKYEKAGTFTTTVTLHFNIDGDVKSKKCSVKIKTSPDKPEECKPGIPVGHEDCEDKPEECKPGVPVGHKDCEDEPEECKPGVPVGHEDCEDKPTPTPEEPETPEEPKGKGEETPVEIPKTGAASVIGAFVGLGSTATALGYYFASRRELLGKMLGR